MKTYLQSLRDSLGLMLSEDKRVCILGEDIADPYGGAFKVTRGLSDQFPQQVFTTPVSEAAIVGIGSGMALGGVYPIAEIMFGDFIALAADQIINSAAKFRKMYNDKVRVPLVIRVPMGGGRGYGPTHSQTLEKIFFGIPHLNIVAPSHFHDPGTLLKRAVFEDHDPVVFVEHKRLYATNLVESDNRPLILKRVTKGSYYETVLVRNFGVGDADVTIVGYGGTSIMIHDLLLKLAQEEINAIACFPASVKPLPESVLIQAASKSGRVVVVEEGSYSFGWGAEVSAFVTEKLWNGLVHPVKRVAAKDTIIPSPKALEEAVLPALKDIENAVYEVLCD